MSNITSTDSPLFLNINPESPIQEIESLCMNCHEKGTTRLLMTKIPFFKDIIIMSFTCQSCGYRTNEIESAADLADKGINFTLKVQTQKDMNRRVIKTNHATVKIPSCGLEIPPETQKGMLSTVEGFIRQARDNFKASFDDGYFAEMGEEFIGKIKETIDGLSDILDGKKYPFDFIVDDPSGNSFVENPYAPQTDPNITVKYFDRTKEMLEKMGYNVENQAMGNKGETTVEKLEEKEEQKTEENKNAEQVSPTYYDKKKDFTVYKSNSEISNIIVDFTKSVESPDALTNSITSFELPCVCCQKLGYNRSCICTIPYFKEIIITCFKCDYCGYKTTEVKGGGGISEKATKLILSVEKPEDLNRDVFKSDSCNIIIPEVGFESSVGSMGGIFTTIEGILDKIAQELIDMPFGIGDSAFSNKINDFVMKIRDFQQMKEKFTIILDDPLSNSFIFPVSDGKEEDSRLKKEEYTRTWEQNEEYGLNDMKTENY